MTGKWLFPKQELENYVRRKSLDTLNRFSTEFALSRDMLLIAGSDDPVLYTMHGILHSLHPGFAIFSASIGSREGLLLLKRSVCHIALSHLYDPEADDFTFPFLNRIFESPEELAVINLFHRTIGFITRDEQVGSFREIVNRKLRFVNRQDGSGIRSRVDRMIAEEGVPRERIPGYDVEVNTHFSVAGSVRSGTADVGIASEVAARSFDLRFRGICEERFDMVVRKDGYFERNVQIFIEFVRSESFSTLLQNMNGYSCRQTGRVLYPKNNSIEGETS